MKITKKDTDFKNEANLRGIIIIINMFGILQQKFLFANDANG